MKDTEARSRLTRVLDVCEHEFPAARSAGDARLLGVLQVMALLRGEIVAALAAVTAERPPTPER